MFAIADVKVRRQHLLVKFMTQAFKESVKFLEQKRIGASIPPSCKTSISEEVQSQGARTVPSSEDPLPGSPCVFTHWRDWRASWAPLCRSPDAHEGSRGWEVSPCSLGAALGRPQSGRGRVLDSG